MDLELTVSGSGAFAPDLRVGRPSADPRGAMPGRPIRQEPTWPCAEAFGGLEDLEDLTHALEKVLGRPLGEAFSDSGSNSQLLNDALAQFTP